MSQTFMLIGKGTKNIEIEKFHINIWYLEKRKFIEIGLLINVKNNIANKNVEFTIDTPFIVKKGSVINLFEKLKDSKNLCLIFNDTISEKKYYSSGDSDNVEYVRFNSGGNFLLIKPSITVKGQNKITINTGKIDPRILKKSISGNRLLCYVRFRFEIDLKNSKNIYLEKGNISEKLYFDLRVNEFRNDEKNVQELSKYIIPAKQIFLFIIIPTNYKLSAVCSGKLIGFRFLEEGMWESYFENLNKEKRKMLVYFWKEKDKETFGQGIIFEKDGDIYRNFRYGIIIIIAAIAGYVSLAYMPINLQKIFKTIMDFVLIIGIGALGSATWDFIKIKIFKLK